MLSLPFCSSLCTPLILLSLSFPIGIDSLISLPLVYPSISLKIFFQGDPLLRYLFGRFFSYISIMPRFINNPRYIGFIFWKPQNKSIFLTMCHQPFLLGCISLLIIQSGILSGNNVHRKSCRMFTGTGTATDFFVSS